MNPRLIDLYNEELQHLRGEAREFGEEYPNAAALLALDKGRAEDPYVERLLEGVAFLAARVRLKLDSQYPVFTQQLVDVLFPGWLAPTPSACVLRLNVDPGDDKLVSGPTIPRGSCVVGSLRGASGLRCEFETTRTVQLLPLQLGAVRYSGTAPESFAVEGASRRAAASLVIEIDLLAETTFAQLDLDNLPVYVTLDEPHASQLMELVAGRCLAVGVSADAGARRQASWLPGSRVRHLGFDADEAMLRIPVRGHTGFRVLREYAALPQKFRFFEIGGLRPALASITGRKVFLHLHLAANHPRLESTVRSDSLALFCTPAVNLRERKLDRCDVEPGQTEYHVVADRGHVRRQEVVQLTEVIGGGDGFERRFAPIFEVSTSGRLATSSFYTARRERRRMTHKELQDRRTWLQGAEGPATSEDEGRQPTSGTETFISLAERGAGPMGRALKYLSMRALCLDREVPRYLRSQPDKARYDAVDSVPVQRIDCLTPPSEPLDYAVDGYEPWVTLSHLFVNYLSLVDAGPTPGADALRAMLNLYAPHRAHPLARQAEGLTGVQAELVTRRIPSGGPLAFARGLKVTLQAGAHGFDGGSPFMLGAMVEHFLASHVGINSFVETTLESEVWPEALTWPTRIGRRPLA